LLRRAREAQGTALETVAERTRIAPHHLEALERSDLDALPPGPFGKGYVRAYAAVLGIDAGPILAAYRSQERQRGGGSPEDERRMLAELSQLAGRGAHESGPAGRAGMRPGWILVFAALGGVATVGWLVASRRPRVPPAASATPAPATAPSQDPVVARPAAPQSPAASARSPVAGRRPTEERVGTRAQPAASPTQAPQESPPTDALRVAGFGVGADVVDRRLVGRSDRFPEGSRVHFWTEVVGGQPGHVVRHVWFQGGLAVMRVNLPVRGPHWRTHSSLVLPRGAAGGWTVEARTPDGRLLARNDFVCERPGSRAAE
jgi:cytoskeletal protein RodZ